MSTKPKDRAVKPAAVKTRSVRKDEGTYHVRFLATGKVQEVTPAQRKKLGSAVEEI